jgi:hypothetical protein
MKYFRGHEIFSGRPFFCYEVHEIFSGRCHGRPKNKLIQVATVRYKQLAMAPVLPRLGERVFIDLVVCSFNPLGSRRRRRPH